MTVLVAVSGGADSVTLLRALVRIKNQHAVGVGGIVAAHFNHRLRGEAADDDARFVEQLCAELEVPFELGTPPDEAALAADSPGLEAAARNLRYQFLSQTAARVGARYVAVAHTADDQIETILHRILRGTGLSGLAGMPRTRRLSEVATLVRPLLDVRREDVIAYLNELGQEFRDDASNADLRYRRNRIRNELLPLLRRDYEPGVDGSILRLGKLAGEAQLVINELTATLLGRALRGVAQASNSFEISIEPLIQQPRYLVREVLLAAWRLHHWPEQAMGFAEWDQLAEMLQRGIPGAKRMLPGAIDAERTSTTLRFAAKATSGGDAAET